LLFHHPHLFQSLLVHRHHLLHFLVLVLHQQPVRVDLHHLHLL
jgi:hypothetical protein